MKRDNKIKPNKERLESRANIREALLSRAVKFRRSIKLVNERNNRPPLAIDSQITAKYAIKTVLGKGSFSQVVRIEHRDTKQPYALKIIDLPKRRDVFEAELAVLQKVNHRNVIKLIEVVECENKVYMIMELATGGSLLDRLEARGTYAESDARVALTMILKGVAYLHGLGITHRDLKPDNLLYYHPGNDSRILITDFGFASIQKPNDNVYMDTVCGTALYVAPEIVKHVPYTSAVDVWAVGIITYVVLSGSFPFDAERRSKIFKVILMGKFVMKEEIWNVVSAEAKDFIYDLLQYDPKERLTAQEALQHPWLQGAVLNSRSQGISAIRPISTICGLEKSEKALTIKKKVQGQES